MTLTATTVYYAANHTELPDILALLNTTHAAASTALTVMRLCPTARTWPPLHLAEPQQLHDRALRDHAYATRSHPDAEQNCDCNPTDIQAAAALADEWLNLWNVTLAHITHPELYDTDLVRRAARLVTDYAAYLTTGNLDHLLPPAPPADDKDQPSPWFQPPPRP